MIHLDGTYLIADPCYIIPYDSWNEFLDRCHYGEINTVEMNGHTYYVVNTAFGDGSYNVNAPDNDPGEFGVDSGMFCIVKDHEDHYSFNYYDRLIQAGLAAIVKLTGNLEVTGGIARINGEVFIDTVGNFEDDL